MYEARRYANIIGPTILSNVWTKLLFYLSKYVYEFSNKIVIPNIDTIPVRNVL